MWGTSLQMLPPDLAQVSSVWLRVAWTESQDFGYPHLRLEQQKTGALLSQDDILWWQGYDGLLMETVHEII